MGLVQQFLKSFRQEDNLEAGLFQKNDGTVWLRNPDGSATQIGSGGPPFVPAAGDDLVLLTDSSGATLIKGGDDSTGLSLRSSDGTMRVVVEDSGIGVGSQGSESIGFYGTSPIAQPVVPLTTPAVQDVIDALIALGLVSQSD